MLTLKDRMDGVLLLKVFSGMLLPGLKKMMVKILILKINLLPKVMLLSKVSLNSLWEN
jgi:hypothetical protein